MMITDTDPVIGWETIGRTSHPPSTEHILVERLWQARDMLIEAEYFCCDTIANLAALADQLTQAEPCACALPEQSCVACRLSAHAVTILAEMGL